MIRTLVLSCFLFAALGSGRVSAQVLIFWDQTEGDWNDPDNWFQGFGPPDSEIGDVGVVSNNGLAFLDSPADFSPGGLILGELANERGTVHLRNNGELSVVEDFDVDGSVLVGQAGLGTLIVDRGASFSAESLRMGGVTASSLVLGGGTTGTAAVTIQGAAALTRHTQIIGPNVNFEAESLNLSGTFTNEITGEQHSTLDINQTANLGGTLDIRFASNFQPTAGQTWDLIDAAQINGRFSDVTSNVSPGPGLAFTVNLVAGGQNGMLAQLGIDARLQLTIDRRTGASRIQNLTSSQSVAINGYGVISRSGLLDENNWNSIDQGGTWAGNGSSTHVAELNLDGSHELGPGADIALGNIYGFEPTELGQSNEDVSFEYHIAGGDVVDGLVDFVGPHNDIVLVVAEDGAYIQNQSTSPLTINGYAILSPAGSLDPTNWTSLADGSDAWTEANAANNHMTELNLGGTMTLTGTSQAIPLGPIVSDGANDLVFVVNLADSGPYTGTIEYEDGIIDFGGALLGDCDGDQALTASDLTCVATLDQRDAVLGALNTRPGDLDGNGDVAFADFLILSGNFGNEGSYADGNIDLTDAIGFSDFLVLSGNFGAQGQAAAVPEPTISALIVVGILLLPLRKKR